jgi:hypothetical protein
MIDGPVFVMAKKRKAKPQERRKEFSRGSVFQAAVPTYKHGDYLRVEFSLGTADAPISFWICVDHCSERPAIVFGIINSETPPCFGNAFCPKLAVSDSCVFR